MSFRPAPAAAPQSPSGEPPAPPPKPHGSRDASRRPTPFDAQTASRPPPLHTTAAAAAASAASDIGAAPASQHGPPSSTPAPPPPDVPDPGPNWLPRMLEDKSKHHLAELLAQPSLVAALMDSSATAHLSFTAAQQPLRSALQENIHLAAHLADVESQLAQSRANTQAQLLAMHALERQWHQKQSEMDRALAPSAPSSLYQRLAQGVQEQEHVCCALEESFLEGEGDRATDRELADWIRRYRDAKKTYYARRERRDRWDEGRVGGWR